ncbi:3'-5' exonuclease [Roseibium aggregatum]|uniref:Exonuclease domain-containing protein n=1 Tax=Roseibium aggregatum TaxID=187304 RepID=A0A939J6I1_9HYPH|nr:3'-5' exonuclease [Roseibium aggregatum]MBN9673305.1 exonuclease domain-containing protein [Roseibium aggregatum]
MNQAIIFDCEYLTVEGAMRRQWCGPLDPDPSVVQIGAVKLSLDPGFEISGTFQVLIRAKDRFGANAGLDPYFTELTGIGQQAVDREGIGLAEALERFDRFSEGANFWSWGKDELSLLAIGCYVEGIAPPIQTHRFGNASGLLLNAGMPYADLQKTTSGQLADYFQIEGSPRRHHDALDDAMSIALTLRYLLSAGRLHPRDFKLPLLIAKP